LAKKGIFQLKDILDKEGSFLTHSELKEKYNLNTNFIERHKIISSIPIEWKTAIIKGDMKLKEWEGLLINIGSKILSIENINTKILYQVHNANKEHEITCKKFWEKEFPLLVEEPNIWEIIYNLTYQYCSETKLISFQYKLINNIINCRVKLKNWRIMEEDKCLYCTETDDIRHFFIHCMKVKDFWLSVFKWWNSLKIELLDLNMPDLEESI
jgi:hypothetical protein